MKRNFDEWLGQFRHSICDYGYWVDFETVYGNVDSIKVELNILNSLVGSRNIVHDFTVLVEQYPQILKCIPVLLAVRAVELYAIDSEGEITYWFSDKETKRATRNSIEQYVSFMEKTGLFDLLSNRIVGSLFDYATGVEAGLNSNARKNRGGKLMETLVEEHLKSFPNLEYYSQFGTAEIQKRWGVDMSKLSNSGKAQKVFDFVVHSADMVYGIEVNFYQSGGSKLNETARSYKSLAIGSQDIPGFEFVWITDGAGWVSARHNLEETFDVLEHVYNIDDLQSGQLEKLFFQDKS